MTTQHPRGSRPRAAWAAIAVLLSVAVLTGCTRLWERSDPCDPGSPAPVKTVTEPAVRQVGENDGNVGIIVTNSGPPTRVTVRVDDAVALDVELPDSVGCSHPPIYTYYYDLPPGNTDVIARAEGSKRKTAGLRVGKGMRWVLVMTQESFPVHLEVSRERPVFG